MDLKDKVCVITGSSSGIGQVLAVRFAEEGCKVVVNYNNNKAGAIKTSNLIPNGQSLVVKADVANEDDCKNMINKTIDKFGRIDILINNAGIGTDKKPFLDQNMVDMVDLLSVNLVGPLFLSQIVYKYFKENNIVGKIINTSSIKGIEYGGGSGVVYAGSKAAINAITKTLAKHFAPNVSVNAVAPGYVEVPRYDSFTKETKDKFLSETTLKRFVTTDEVADTFIFLAKNDAMTGQVIYVDAGFTLK